MKHEQHFEAHLYQGGCEARIWTFTIKFHRIGYEKQEPKISHKENFAPNAYTIEESCRRWNSLHKQRNIQSEHNQIPLTRHYVHYAPTTPTNCTSEDNPAQQEAKIQ